MAEELPRPIKLKQQVPPDPELQVAAEELVYNSFQLMQTESHVSMRSIPFKVIMVNGTMSLRTKRHLDLWATLPVAAVQNVMAASAVWMPALLDVMFAATVAARQKSNTARLLLPTVRTLVALAEMEPLPVEMVLPPADLLFPHPQALNHPVSHPPHLVSHPPHPVLVYHQLQAEGVVRRQLL